MLKSYIDSESYQMAHEIIEGFTGDVGFNAGSQIVQIIGITALDKVDHFIKEGLRVKFYIRYMDDFVLIHSCRGFLGNCLKEIAAMLERQKMRLNEAKTRITELSKGISFLGFIFRLTETGKVVILADPKKIKHEKKKLKRMMRLVKDGKLSKRDLDTHFRCWKASIRYGNSHNLLHKLNLWYKKELSQCL